MAKTRESIGRESRNAACSGTLTQRNGEFNSDFLCERNQRRQTLRVRFALVLAVCFALPLPAKAQEVWPGPQSALGVSFVPVAAEWIPKKSVFSGSTDPRPTFCLRFKTTPNDWSQTPRLLRLLDPQGHLISLSTRQFGTVPDHGDENFVTCDAVDPRWPFIEAQWEVFKPEITNEERGNRDSSVEFKAVPLPDAAHPSVEIHQTLPTDSGLNVVLQSAQFLPEEQKIEFQLDWTPPKEFADVEASLSQIEAKAPDWNFKTANWGAYYQNANFRIDAPPFGVKMCDLKLSWREMSQLRAKPNTRTTLSYRINLPTPPSRIAPSADDAKGVSLVPFTSPHTRGALEVGAAKWNWNHSILWCETPEEKREANWTWQPQELELSFPDGDKMQNGTPVLDSPMWHADGTPAQNREMPFGAQWEEKAAPFSARLKLEKVRRLSSETVLSLPVLPARGQTLEAKDLGVDDDTVSVERAIGYKSLEELPFLAAELRPQFPKEGIALVLKIQPVFANSTFEFSLLELFDGQNRVFTHEGDAPKMFGRDLTRAGESSLYRTVFLPAFAPTTTDLKLRYRFVETQKSGQTEQATFDVAK